MKPKSRPVLDAIRELQDYLSKIENAIQNQDLESAYQDIKDRPRPKRIIDEIEKTLRWKLCQNFPAGSEVASKNPNYSGTGVVTKSNGYVHVTWYKLRPKPSPVTTVEKITHGDPTSLILINKP